MAFASGTVTGEAATLGAGRPGRPAKDPVPVTDPPTGTQWQAGRYLADLDVRAAANQVPLSSISPLSSSASCCPVR